MCATCGNCEATRQCPIHELNAPTKLATGFRSLKAMVRAEYIIYAAIARVFSESKHLWYLRTNNINTSWPQVRQRSLALECLHSREIGFFMKFVRGRKNREFSCFTQRLDRGWLCRRLYQNGWYSLTIPICWEVKRTPHAHMHRFMPVSFIFFQYAYRSPARAHPIKVSAYVQPANWTNQFSVHF